MCPCLAGDDWEDGQLEAVDQAVVVQEGRPLALGAFTVRGDRIVEIDIIADPERLAALGLPF